jgi:CBS domain-containing protein
MSSELITGSSDDEVGAIMGLLTKHRIRHLPIVDDGQLAGIISIGDVVKAQHDQLSMENHYLKSYIQS